MVLTGTFIFNETKANIFLNKLLIHLISAYLGKANLSTSYHVLNRPTKRVESGQSKETIDRLVSCCDRPNAYTLSCVLLDKSVKLKNNQ